MNHTVSPTPDSELVNLGTPATTGLLGVIAGIVAKLIHGRRSTNRRIKAIENTVNEIQADRAVKYQEFNSHRNTVTDAIAGLRDSVDRVDSKIDAVGEKINEKLDTTAEAVAFIRGRMEGERDGRS